MEQGCPHLERVIPEQLIQPDNASQMFQRKPVSQVPLLILTSYLSATLCSKGADILWPSGFSPVCWSWSVTWYKTEAPLGKAEHKKARGDSILVREAQWAFRRGGKQWVTSSPEAN